MCTLALDAMPEALGTLALDAMPEALGTYAHSLQHAHGLLVLSGSHPFGPIGPVEWRGQSSRRLWGFHDTFAWHYECHQPAAGD